MTLIAAVRANDGIAICADSQETVGDYRRSVQKIAPIKNGLLELVIAGAGNGDLIESFIAVFSRRLADANISTLVGFVEHFESELAAFYESDVASSEDKNLFLFVAASIPTRRECDVWTARHRRLKPLGKADLIGWDETLYYRTLHQYEGIGVSQAVLAAIHTVLVAYIAELVLQDG